MSFSERASELFPPKPVFPVEAIPDLSGKVSSTHLSTINPQRPSLIILNPLPQVYIVTGGASGVGYETAKVLYQKSATVYIAGRSRGNGEKAIDAIRGEYPSAKGKLFHLDLDLADLRGVKASAEEFLRKEKRLDVLWLNAGVMHPPTGSVSAQGYDLQLGTNALGHFLFAINLTSILSSTAKVSPPGAVRVVFVSSSAHQFAPAKGGIKWDDINFRNGGSTWEIYGQSKAGGILLSLEFAKRFAHTGVISVVCLHHFVHKSWSKFFYVP